MCGGNKIRGKERERVCSNACGLLLQIKMYLLLKESDKISDICQANTRIGQV